MKYTVVITILTLDFESAIHTALIGQGWKISPIPRARGGFMTNESKGNIGDILCFRIERTIGEKADEENAIEIRKVVEEVLEAHKISYFSIVVFHAAVKFDWVTGNIPRPPKIVATSSWERLDSEDLQ